MPRATKDQKFGHSKLRGARFRGKVLVFQNNRYEGDQSNLTLRDLLEYLDRHRFKPEDVELPAGFATAARAPEAPPAAA